MFQNQVVLKSRILSHIIPPHSTLSSPPPPGPGNCSTGLLGVVHVPFDVNQANTDVFIFIFSPLII